MTWKTGSGQSPTASLDAFANAVRAKAPQAIDALAVSLKSEIERQLSTPGQGRYYAKLADDGRTNIGPFRGRRGIGPLSKAQARAEKLNTLRQSTAAGLNAGTRALSSISRRDVLTGLHRASKPGDPPAPDTGALKRSTFVERIGKGARVGVAMLYAKWLEFGTATIRPRPFMRPALAQIRARFGPIVRDTLRVGSSGAP